MKAHDKYYGQALQEAESGKRRDDLWGRAFAQAKGDQQAASGIYIDLLAKRMEEDAGAPERIAHVEEAKLIAGAVGSIAVEGTRRLVVFAVRWAIRFAICLIASIGLTYIGTTFYSQQKARQLTEKWVPAHEEALSEGIQKFRSLHGNSYSEEEIRKDFSSLDFLPLQIKYGSNGLFSLAEEFRYDPYQQARWDSRVKIDTSFSIGFLVFLVLFVGWVVLAWRRYFDGRKPRSAQTLPSVKV